MIEPTARRWYSLTTCHLSGSRSVTRTAFHSKPPFGIFFTLVKRSAIYLQTWTLHCQHNALFQEVVVIYEFYCIPLFHAREDTFTNYSLSEGVLPTYFTVNHSYQDKFTLYMYPVTHCLIGKQKMLIAISSNADPSTQGVWHLYELAAGLVRNLPKTQHLKITKLNY